MSKYTADQVEAAANGLLYPGLESCDMAVEADMLRAYAELLRELEQKWTRHWSALNRYSPGRVPGIAQLLRERERKEVMRNGGDGVSTVSAVTGGAHRTNAQVVEKVAKAIAPCSWDDLDSFEIAAYTMRAIMAIDAYEAAKPAAEGEAVGEVFGPKALSNMVALDRPLPPGTKLYTHPAERAAVPERIDIQRVPVISTRHVSGERFCWLAHKARLRAAERDNGEMPVASYGWGYWLYVPDDWVGVNTHADLSPVFEWFDGLDLGGDRWLRIDADGPVIPGLPIFEW